MTTRGNWSILAALFLLLSLFLVACVRPLPGDDIAAPTATPVETESDTQPETYPGPEIEEPSAGDPAEESYPAAEESAESSTELLQPADESQSSPEDYPAPESETAEGEHLEGETVEGEHVEGETAEGEAVEGEAVEGETVEGEAVEGEAVEGEAVEGEAVEGEAVEGEAVESDAAEGDSADPSTDTTVVETGRTHIVVPGETLFRIGMQYGMSWVTLAEANGLTSPNSLYIGQVLTIPDVETSEEATDSDSAETTETEESADSAETSTETEAEETTEAGEAESVEGAIEQTTYIVQSGDTLYRISVQFGVSMMEIARENELANFNQIYAGQELSIPQVETEEGAEADTAATESVESAETHLVVKGETVFTIAFKYGIAWTKLVEANEIASPYTLEAGQTLVIPAGE